MMNSMMDLLRDRQITTADQTSEKAMGQMQALSKELKVPHSVHSPVAENAESVPGFPQDAFMEMGLDGVVEKPETHGLPANWSAGMMGMMTMVRVLPDKEYDEMQQRIREQKEKQSEEHRHAS